MKNSELKKLIQEYHALKSRQAESYDHRTHLRIKEIEHRYYHETGSALATK